MPRKNPLAPVRDRETARIDAIMRDLHERPDDPLTHAQISRLFRKKDGKPSSRQRIGIRIRRAGGKQGPVARPSEIDTDATGIIYDPEVTSIKMAAAKIHRSEKYLKDAWKRGGMEKQAQKQIYKNRRQQRLERFRQIADEFRQYAVELRVIPSATWLMRNRSAFYAKVEHTWGGFKELRKKFPDLRRKPGSPTPEEWFPPEESASA